MDTMERKKTAKHFCLNHKTLSVNKKPKLEKENDKNVLWELILEEKRIWKWKYMFEINYFNLAKRKLTRDEKESIEGPIL